MANSSPHYSLETRSLTQPGACHCGITMVVSKPQLFSVSIFNFNSARDRSYNALLFCTFLFISLSFFSHNLRHLLALIVGSRCHGVSAPKSWDCFRLSVFISSPFSLLIPPLTQIASYHLSVPTLFPLSSLPSSTLFILTHNS